MDAEEVYGALNRKIRNIQASGGGVTDYRDLDGKPRVNGVTLQGDLTSQELGIQEFSGDYQDLQGTPDALPCPFPVTFKGMLPNVSYDGSEPVNITFPDMELTNQSAGTPVGEIISYMGTIAPPNYLICDGTEYAITDYPYLAQHFIDNFGSANFFGGDGETTFAVPDLRGEFLRGTGLNSHANQGKGAEVGQHQNATVVANVQTVSGGARLLAGFVNANNYAVSSEGDYIHYALPSNSVNMVNVNGTNGHDPAKVITKYAVRTTNTSVLYCIKCKPTFFVQAQHVYSYEERRVGTWTDGKPLYEKTVDFGELPVNNTKEVLHGITEIDNVFIHDGYIKTSSNGFASLELKDSGLKSTVRFFVTTSRITCLAGTTNWSGNNAIVVLRYTKVTD